MSFPLLSLPFPGALMQALMRHMYSVSDPVDSRRALASLAAADAPAALVGFPFAPFAAFPFAGAASGLGFGFVWPSSAREFQDSGKKHILHEGQ